MQELTYEEIVDKIDRLKSQRESTKVVLPFDVVVKTIRATGVCYQKRDNFLYSDISDFHVESNYSANEMTLLKSGEGLRMIVLSHSQYVVVQKLLNHKAVEIKKLGSEIEKLSDLLAESERESE